VAEGLTHFGDFKPRGELPDPKSLGRYSDDALYALALYIYSLEPPPNPNRPTALSRRGEEVFDREGCALCHTPPLYTNNALIPAEGFDVPDGHDESDEILHVSVGNDTRLALQTRKGTGYYRVPSLKGVWYRGPFEHNGSVATLEDWFDPERLKDDYEPSLIAIERNLAQEVLSVFFPPVIKLGFGTATPVESCRIAFLYDGGVVTSPDNRESPPHRNL